MEEKPQWKSRLGSYAEIRTLTFETVEELDKAIDVMWDETEPLHKVPRDYIDARTIIVPADAVFYFKEKGFVFRANRGTEQDSF